MYLSEIADDRAFRRIDMTPLKRNFTTDLNMLLKLMEAYGFKLRIVGGAVRDVLLGLAPRDIDLLTDALPDQVMYVLSKHKIPYVTKGIPHGTVKVKFLNGEEYEITSLAFEIEDECCPPRVIVHSGASWKADAERRDFTIDTMSLTFDGLLYDYLNGVQDLRNQFVRFIGDPASRIQKDPVLIMRFFKLLSLFRDPKFDKSVIPVLKEKMKLVRKLKPDRLQKELGNVKRGVSADKVLKMMSNLGFDDVVKEMNECALVLHEAAVHNLVPALKIVQSDGETVQIVRGRPGQTHADIWEPLEASGRVPEDASVDGGFFDTRHRRYLTRVEATRLISDDQSASNQLNSLELVKAQQAHY